MLTNQLDWLADSRPWGTRKTVAEAVGMQWRIVSSGRETTVPVKLTISKMFAVNACDWALCRTIALSHAMFYKCGAKKIWMKMRRKSALYWDVIWFSVFANPIQFCTPTDSKPNYHFSESMVHFVAESLKVDYIANGKWLRLTSARLHKNLQGKIFEASHMPKLLISIQKRDRWHRSDSAVACGQWGLLKSGTAWVVLISGAAISALSGLEQTLLMILAMTDTDPYSLVPFALERKWINQLCSWPLVPTSMQHLSECSGSHHWFCGFWLD